MRKILLLFLLLFCPKMVRATCTPGTNVYYIDSGAGSDSNTQTQAKSKSTPWAHQPYMANFTGSYSHTAGDCFIFKGGSTWPHASFPITVGAGGTSSASDYYGVDVTWFSGTNSGTVNTSGTQVTQVSGEPFQDSNTSWVGGNITIGGTVYVIASVQSPQLLTLTTSAGTQTGVSYSNSLFVRPIFNSGGTIIGTNDVEFDLQHNSISYVTIDNIEWENHFWSGNLTSFGLQNMTVNGTSSASGILIEHNYVHGWTHAAYSGPQSYLQNGYVIFFGLGSPCTTCLVLDNLASGETADGGDPDSGTFTFNQYAVTNNIMHGLTDGINGSGHLANGNTMFHINDSYDSQTGNSNDQHSDAMFTILYAADAGPQYIYNNLIYGVSEGTEGPMFIEVGAQHLGCDAVTAYVFNNTVYYGDWGPQFPLDNRFFGTACNPVPWTYHIWNNTIVQNATGCPPNVLCTAPSVPGQNVTSLACIRLAAGQGSGASAITFNTMDLRNNHCISNYSSSTGTTSCSGSGGTGKIYDCGVNTTITNFTDTDNILTTLSAATTAGYVVTNNFSQTSSGNPTVGQGANLTSLATGALAPLAIGFNPVNPTANGNARPATGSWDSSADEFVSGANVTLTPSSQNFGTISVGSSSSPVTFTITNNSAANATSVTPVTTGGNSTNFTISSNTCGTVTNGGGTCTFTVTFSPLAAGFRSTTLSVSYGGGDGASPQTAALSGTGGSVVLSPSSQNFGSVNVGSSSSAVTFTLTNNSTATATSITPIVTGGNTGDFTITNSGAGSCSAAGNSISVSASCTVKVTFSPTASGSRSTTLSISYSGGDGNAPQISSLSGTGVTSSAVGSSMSGGAQIINGAKVQ